MVGFRIFRLQPQGFAKSGDGLVKLAFRQERDAEVVAGLRVVGRETQGLAIAGNGIVEPTQVVQGFAKIVMRRGDCRA